MPAPPIPATYFDPGGASAIAHARERLILLSGREPSAEERRFLAFAAWAGCPPEVVSLDEGRALARLLDELEPETYCLALSAARLAGFRNTAIPASDPPSFAEKLAGPTLIFGCDASPAHRIALSELTAGAIPGLVAGGDRDPHFSFPEGARTFSRQLAGLSYAGACREPFFTFELRDAAAATETIMAARSADGNPRPVFLRMEAGSCPLFLLSVPVADLEQSIDRERQLNAHYHGVVPLLIFLRHCLGGRCWHGAESGARLIIDDPLLEERYGFLEQSALMESMRRCRFGTSIAFIPWNYRRTSRGNALRLLGENSNLSLCVHGCDHANKEFAAPDSALLERKAGLALQRMEAQKQRTGAAFEPVMVFPQGIFSTAAIKALRATNYLAAVNSTCFSTDMGNDDFKVWELLQPAVTRYGGFPIFPRRYPRGLFDFAFDLFLGRPAFIVEHHEYFRQGCGAIEGLVADLYKVDPTLSWPTLTEQIMRSCMKKRLPDGSFEVRFFTRRFQWANPAADPVRFRLSKHEPDAAVIESVFVDGTRVPFSIDNDFLQVEVEAPGGQVLNLEVVDRDRAPRQFNGFGIAHDAGVWLRRGLSEFRDNTLARHDGTLKLAQALVRGLKVTGDA